MRVTHLGNTAFNDIMKCFLEAFEGYYVKMPTDYDYYKNRWKAAKVDFELSYGMFDGNKLVGFIIHAIDQREGGLIAFNTGTGVLPDYRGKRIVKSIYEYAIPELVKQGVTKSVLEVITANERAIKAYANIGFTIRKEFKCFKGEISVDDHFVNINEVDFDAVTWENILNQDKYSWDFNSSSLKQSNARYFNVLKDGEVVSFFSMNPENNTINQMEVLMNQSGNWEQLFSAIQSISKEVRIINVDSRLEEKLDAIKKVGLKNTVNQYEMELAL